jgi:general secretion pathway protein K
VPSEGSATLPDGSIVGVNSGYFIVHCRIHSARINVRIDTLIARCGIGNYSWTAVIWAHRLVD